MLHPVTNEEIKFTKEQMAVLITSAIREKILSSGQQPVVERVLCLFRERKLILMRRKRAERGMQLSYLPITMCWQSGSVNGGD